MSVKLLLPLLLACVGTPEDDDDDHGDDSGSADSGEDADTVRVAVETTAGAMVFELDLVAAPVTAANFLTYVDEGFFDGADGLGATTFHRVIAGFMIQGGGYTETGAAKSTHEAIPLESENGLSNLRGTIAMARTNDPDSATTQFFVNVVDNLFLDYENARNPGYAVFGEVVEGMDAADAIAAVPVDSSDEPLTPIVITACARE